ncbi:alpha/beta hydrolase fold domain-containing protein [Rhizobium leguminosarum]|nr:alpha/beta hydrolase fold domain-containing protein [Rhizobium ruizarguesonis]TCA30182.1 alpha/beta hydrolase [Rhizobium leguminosarum bv. viciae]
MGAAGQPASIAEMRLNDDQWAVLTAEPDNVDYVHTTMGGVRCLWAMPKGSDHERVLVCFHGGGYLMGSVYSHRKLYGQLAKAAGVRALLVDYRLMPEHAFPAQSDDAIQVYRALLLLGIHSQCISFVGDSAGGGLAVSTALRARDEGLPQPAGLMTMSAWTDMSLRGSSYETNRSKDLVFRREMIDGLVAMLLGSESDRHHPYASPIDGDLKGLAPVYLQVGGDENLLDDSVGLAERAKAAGVETKIDIFDGMLHSFQMAAGRAPEADEAIARLAAWIRPRLQPLASV